MRLRRKCVRRKKKRSVEIIAEAGAMAGEGAGPGPAGYKKPRSNTAGANWSCEY